MNIPKVRICFSGNLSTKVIAQLTDLFSRYRINILDINMFNLQEDKATLSIVCQSSSTTDEIDSFWNDIVSMSDDLNLIYSKQYVT